MYYAEWCSRPERRCGIMLPVDRLPNEGFRSVYEFDEEDARTIRISG